MNMVAIFSKFSWCVYSRLWIIKLQTTVINICNQSIVQTFKITSRIDVHFEVRKGFLGNLTIDIQHHRVCVWEREREKQRKVGHTTPYKSAIGRWVSKGSWWVEPSHPRQQQAKCWIFICIDILSCSGMHQPSLVMWERERERTIIILKWRKWKWEDGQRRAQCDIWLVMVVVKTLHTRVTSRDHEIVRAQKKASKGCPKTPPKSCSVVTDPQV